MKGGKIITTILVTAIGATVATLFIIPMVSKFLGPKTAA